VAEGKRLAKEWRDRLESWDVADLAALERTPANKAPLDESVTGPSGARYRVRACEPWESDLYIQVRVYSQRGLRRWWGYWAAGGWYGDLPHDRPPA
jgi:hypothetical protein